MAVEVVIPSTALADSALLKRKVPVMPWISSGSEPALPTGSNVRGTCTVNIPMMYHLTPREFRDFLRLGCSKYWLVCQHAPSELPNAQSYRLRIADPCPVHHGTDGSVTFDATLLNWRLPKLAKVAGLKRGCRVRVVLYPDGSATEPILVPTSE